jgi:hypothetical protein
MKIDRKASGWHGFIRVYFSELDAKRYQWMTEKSGSLGGYQDFEDTGYGDYLPVGNPWVRQRRYIAMTNGFRWRLVDTEWFGTKHDKVYREQLTEDLYRYLMYRLYPDRFVVEPISKRRVNWRHLKPRGYDNPVNLLTTSRGDSLQRMSRRNPISPQMKGAVIIGGVVVVGALAIYLLSRDAQAAQPPAITPPVVKTQWVRLQPDSNGDWLIPAGTSFRISDKLDDVTQLGAIFNSIVASPDATVSAQIVDASAVSDWPTDDPAKAPTDLHVDGTVNTGTFTLSGPFNVWTEQAA